MFMRSLPKLTAAAFVVITLFRVGVFADERMHAGPLGWVFSVFLGVGVYMSSYWTRDSLSGKDGKPDTRNEETKRAARLSLVFFVAIDGLFNMAEVWLATSPKWELSNWLMISATVSYGLFPTTAAAILGSMQGKIDRLPKTPTNERLNVSAAFRRWIVSGLMRATVAPDVENPAVVVDGQAKALNDPVDNGRQTALPAPAMVDSQPAESLNPAAGLTGTRLQVYNALSNGETPKTAADRLKLSRQTVYKHRAALIDAGILEDRTGDK